MLIKKKERWNNMVTITYNGAGTIIGLSTETKPTTDIMDGTQLMELDTKKAYMFYKGTWYEL